MCRICTGLFLLRTDTSIVLPASNYSSAHGTQIQVPVLDEREQPQVARERGAWARLSWESVRGSVSTS